MSVGSISYAQNAYIREMLAANSAGHAARKDRNLPASETTVTISDDARERLRAEAAPGQTESKAAAGGFKVEGWAWQDFSDDILAEARARLAERRPAPGLEGGSLPGDVAGLPLVPENQELLDKLSAEMGKLRQDLDDPAKLQRFNELMNLHATLQRIGWTRPLTEEDVSRELSINQAMGKLQSMEPRPEPAPDNTYFGGDAAAPDPMAGWRKRWEEDGRTMPEVEPQAGRSFWLDLARKSGIGEEEFVQAAREFAKSYNGEALTQRIEGFISERHAALEAAGKGEPPVDGNPPADARAVERSLAYLRHYRAAQAGGFQAGTGGISVIGD